MRWSAEDLAPILDRLPDPFTGRDACRFMTTYIIRPAGGFNGRRAGWSAGMGVVTAANRLGLIHQERRIERTGHMKRAAVRIYWHKGEEWTDADRRDARRLMGLDA